MRLLVRAPALVVLLLALGSPARPRSALASPASRQQKAQKTAPQTAAKTPAVGQVKREVRLVNIVFSVLDRNNRFVTDLRRDNFEIFDENLPQQIEFFSRQADLPLRVGILLDTSNSMHSQLEFEKNAAYDFLYKVIKPGRDLAFVMTFDSHPQLQQAFTDDMDLLRLAIFNQRAGGGTALFDAIEDASRDHLMNPPLPSAGSEVRRVLVVLSDGDDDLSNHTLNAAVGMAERAGVVIYAISTSQQWLSPDQKGAQDLPVKTGYTPGDRVLQQISSDTGGRSFYPYLVTDLAQAFSDIGTELRSQYAVAFTPSYHAGDGKFHQIHIEILDANGLKVHARQGYWAEKIPASSVDSPSH